MSRLFQGHSPSKLIKYKKDKVPVFLELLFFLFLAFVLVYFLNVRINRMLFLLFLPLVWLSKRDYFWLVFFFILMEQPGGLFSGGLRDDQYRLPIYTLAPGFSIAFSELFILLLLAKTIITRRYRINYFNPFFHNHLKMLLVLYLVLIMVSLLMGMGINSMVNIIKLSIALSLFYSVVRILNSEDQIINFLRLIFPFAFVALALQVYGLINGEQLIALVKPGVLSSQGVYDISGGQTSWLRPIEMSHAMLVAFTGSLWLLAKGNSDFKKQYLLLINLLSFLVIFLSGTRSWVISFIIGYVLFFLFMGIKTPKLPVRSFIAIMLFAFVISTFPVINRQIQNSWSRIVTLEKVIEGDITGGGTIGRYDVRAPRVIEGYFSSTIILGAGFSDHFFKYADGHVGYHNILLNTGIAGLILFLFIIYKVLRYPFIINKIIVSNKSMLKTSIIPLVILLIINAGTQTIGFTPDGVNRIILMAFSLIMIDIAVKGCIDKIELR